MDEILQASTWYLVVNFRSFSVATVSQVLKSNICILVQQRDGRASKSSPERTERQAKTEQNRSKEKKIKQKTKKGFPVRTNYKGCHVTAPAFDETISNKETQT